MARKKKGIPGFSFSWKRASGLSSAQVKAFAPNWHSTLSIGPSTEDWQSHGLCSAVCIHLGRAGHGIRWSRKARLHSLGITSHFHM